FLSGGPPQHDTFDPKPEAPREIRGALGSIPTSVPGVHFGELLPKTARLAHRLTVLRSLTTGINSHAVSGYQMMTGRAHESKTDVPPSPRDWPCLGSLVGALNPSDRTPLSVVTLPEPVLNNPGVLWPGQDGGFMGSAWDPSLFTCDPSAPDFRIDELSLPDGISLDRLASRQGLVSELDQQLLTLDRSDALSGLDAARAQAFELLTSGTARAAFELEHEKAALRDRYGRHKLGQSVLLARRLVEAGVRLVQVNFPREPGDLSSGNPLWDTHSNNAARLKDALCPPFDSAFSALLTDLEERGLLDETLVVVFGEFGRSPKINKNGGRDHWGACFSGVMAGAGLEGGRVLGASDAQGAYVAKRPVRPAEFNATILHLLGIDPATQFHDRLNRPLPAADARPVRELVG
ncbi:MAG: hypothetical protein ACI8UO_005592, partial [Verrucomicrobiales bacterium]